MKCYEQIPLIEILQCGEFQVETYITFKMVINNQARQKKRKIKSFFSRGMNLGKKTRLHCIISYYYIAWDQF